MRHGEPKQTNLLTSLQLLCEYASGIVKDIFILFTLEIRLAGKSLVIIAILVTLISILLLSTWFALLGALTTWLTTFHLSLILSLLAVSAFNLILAISVMLYLKKVTKNLKFKETRKQIEPVRQDDYETITSKN